MNYVFFFADELRADALHCYGNKITQTPNFDKLADEGVLFEQCHNQHTVCSPSRCSLITGRYPHADGHRSLWNLVKPYEKNLFGYLKEAGYDVHIYGKNDMFSKDSIDKFTDEFYSVKDSLKTLAKPVKPYGEKGYYNFLYEPVKGTAKELSDYKNVMEGINFIKSWKPEDKPFILFLPLIYPHCPYTAPEPYYSMYFDKMNEIELRPICDDKPAYHSLIRQYRDLDGKDSRKIHAVYLGMVTYSDMLLGKVMECLKETNHEDDTMLIASSDHGDYAGDYALVEKWSNACEDILTRVPLVIRSKNVKAGHRVKEIVELFDIMPTILETANIKPTHAFNAKSLVEQLGGMPGDKNRMAFCEGGYNPDEPQCSEGSDKPSVQWMTNPKNIYYPKHLQQRECPRSIARSVMVRSCDYKYVRRCFGENELYDLNKDPNELNNLYGQTKYYDIQEKLEKQLLDWYLFTSDAVPYEEDLRDNIVKRKTKLK